jgi:hypothetical protein
MTSNGEGATLNPKARRCTATCKASGERCKNPAAFGRNVCRMHGAGGGARPRNLNGLKHGLNSSRAILNEDEQAFFDATVANFLEEYPRLSGDPAALALLDELALHVVGRQRAAGAIGGGNSKIGWQSYERHGRRISELLKNLGIRPDSKERKKEDVIDPHKVIREFVLSLVDHARERNELPTKGAGHLINPPRTINVKAGATVTTDKHNGRA